MTAFDPDAAADPDAILEFARGTDVQAVVDAGQVIVTLADRVLGRTAAEDVIDAVLGETRMKCG